MKYRILQVFWVLAMMMTPSLLIASRVEQKERLLCILGCLVALSVIGYVFYLIIIIIEAYLISWIVQKEDYTPITNFLKIVVFFPLYIQKRIEKKEIEKTEEIKLVNKILHENGIVDKNGKIV
jgi:amino acid permease